MLRLYIRQKKTFDLQGNEIYYAGSSVYSLQSQLGQLPNSRLLKQPNGNPYPSGQWVDATTEVSDIHKLSLTWTAERSSDGQLSSTGTEEKKTASGVLTFEGEAYFHLKRWLVDDVSAVNNQMEVRIDHEGCGSYTDWVIKSTDVTWCEDNSCIFDVSMQQVDDAYQCIRNTILSDNWQGWFNENGIPSNGKRHPRFSYCVEQRSEGMLGIMWALIGQTGFMFVSIVFVFGLIWNSIVAIMIAILSLFAVFSQKVRDKIKDLEDKIITLKDFNDIIGNFFIESAGCGREQPAPLIRDYITNVCDKCGVVVTPDSVPIFFKQQINIETSADRFAKRGAQTRDNPHYNACYFASVVKKGVRRFDDLSLINGVNMNTSTFWLPHNAPVLTFDAFLDQLKGLYNAEWRIENNVLYFNRRDTWQDEPYLFDFSDGSADREQLIRGICYEWNGNKMPAAIDGLYQPDGSDVSGNGAAFYYNRVVSTGNSQSNPVFEGTKVKLTTFSPAKFRLDGADDDYLLNAWRITNNSSLILGALWTPQFVNSVMNQYFSLYADYVLLLKQETSVAPKVLLWDGQSFTNAKCIKPYAAVPINMGSPVPNVPYNNYQGTKQWQQLYPPDTKVGGREIGNPGVYQISSPWMVSGAYRRDALLVNYPMYFAPEFEGSMWDWFHWVDDPRFNPSLNRNVTIKVDLCCDTLKRIQPFGNGRNVILGKKIKLGGAYGDGQVTNIEINYDPENEDGMYIELRVNA